MRPGASGCLSNPTALLSTEPWRLWSELRGASSLAIAYSPAAGNPGAQANRPCKSCWHLGSDFTERPGPLMLPACLHRVLCIVSQPLHSSLCKSRVHADFVFL